MATAPVGVHRVRRPFDADGRRLVAGDLVDVTGWRNAYQLVERGFLVVCPETVLDSPVRASDPGNGVTYRDSGVSPVQVTTGGVVGSGGCPTCGAVDDQPCRSRSGRDTVRHRSRN